jgi:methylenetetrahydrofolate reductase (NADPH)
MHSESKSKEEDLMYLKRKVDAGADMIITQLFYDPDEYLDYYDECVKIGITVPNIPGLLPIQNYNSFKRVVDMCSLKVPQELLDNLENCKSDDEKVKELGIENCTFICRKLLEREVKGIHFYTMNLEKSTTEVLKNLGLKIPSKARELPWKKYTNPRRNEENVRPIFWKYNSKSYLSKTFHWDEYPNGIWGDSRSPAFGNVTEHFVSLCKGKLGETKKRKNLRKIWGEKLQSIQDVEKVFINYIEGNIKKLPWCEESELQNEIIYIKDLLINMNQNGILTVNSQPAVNGKPSDDKIFGWGPSDGYVYQKMYVEFFIEKTKLEKLICIMKNYPSVNFQALNNDGDSIQGIQQTNSQSKII